MQHTTLPDAGTTRGTGDGGDLPGREFCPFHTDRMQHNPIAKLLNFEHCRY